MTYTQYSLQVTQILNLIYYICSSMVQEMYILALQISSLQSVDCKIYCGTRWSIKKQQKPHLTGTKNEEKNITC